MAYYKSKLASGGTVIGGVDEIPINSKNAYPVVYNNTLYLLTTVIDGAETYTYLHYWDEKSWHLVHTTTQIKINNYAIPLIFDGRLIVSSSSGLWEWNNTDWERICALPSKASDRYPVVYNGKLHLINEAINTSLSQYWVWDGTDWSTRTNVIRNLVSTGNYAMQPIVYNDCINVFLKQSSNKIWTCRITDDGVTNKSITDSALFNYIIGASTVVKTKRVEWQGSYQVLPFIYIIGSLNQPQDVRGYWYEAEGNSAISMKATSNNAITVGGLPYKAVLFKDKIHFINFADGKHYIFDGEEWESGSKTLGTYIKQSTILLK